MNFSGPDNKPFLPAGVRADVVTAGNVLLDNQLNSAAADAAKSAAYKEGLQMLADSISTKNVEQAFSEFMNSTQDLNINPDDPVRQEAFKNSGQSFSTELNSLGNQFTEITRKITQSRDLKQIQLENIQQAMSELTRGSASPETLQQLDAMKKQVMMLSSSIDGYNQILSGVIPPISSMYISARDQVVNGTNASYGQNIIDTSGGFQFDPNNLGNVKDLTEFGSQKFNNDMGVMQTHIGSKLNAAGMANDALQAILDGTLKTYNEQTGVDLTEQTIKMLQYQRMYEAGTKVIQAQDNMLGSLLNIMV
jgi:flagellar hook-associated protein FlgK